MDSSLARAFLERLENFGSSLYELDEVGEVFAKSTLQGLLYVSARSAATAFAFGLTGFLGAR